MIARFIALAVLAGSASAAADAPLPATLAQTERAEAIAFTPRYPLWSDGMEKRRKLYLPPGAAIEISTMPRLLTERAQLQQVLMNLLSNAIKHTRRSDPHVKISAEDQGEFFRFEVADNGPGIPRQYQERIWGMFQTLASRDKVEGSGIGLATVKKLVERQGGRVGVESVEGEGARFFFFWPKHNGT